MNSNQTYLALKHRPFAVSFDYFKSLPPTVTQQFLMEVFLVAKILPDIYEDAYKVYYAFLNAPLSHARLFRRILDDLLVEYYRANS